MWIFTLAVETKFWRSLMKLLRRCKQKPRIVHGRHRRKYNRSQSIFTASNQMNWNESYKNPCRKCTETCYYLNIREKVKRFRLAWWSALDISMSTADLKPFRTIISLRSRRKRFQLSREKNNYVTYSDYKKVEEEQGVLNGLKWYGQVPTWFFATN